MINFNGKRLCAFLLVLTLMLQVSCASRQTGWSDNEETVSLSDKEKENLVKKSMDLWKKRHETASLLEALKIFETLSKAEVDQAARYEWLVYLTRGHYFLADAHYEEKELKLTHWEIGTRFGEKAMATNSKFAEAMKANKSVSEALVHLDQKQIAAVYWTAVNLGKWGKEQGLTTVLKYKSQIKDMVTFVENTDKTFFAGASDRYWGVYYAVDPSFAGGDIKKSKTYFDQVMKNYPDYLASHVLYAQYWTTKSNKPDEFTTILNQVVAKKLDEKSDYYPENFLEVKKAKKLLTQKEDLF